MPGRFTGELLTMGRYTNPASYTIYFQQQMIYMYNCTPMAFLLHVFSDRAAFGCQANQC